MDATDALFSFDRYYRQISVNVRVSIVQYCICFHCVVLATIRWNLAFFIRLVSRRYATFLMQMGPARRREHLAVGELVLVLHLLETALHRALMAGTWIIVPQ